MPSIFFFSLISSIDLSLAGVSQYFSSSDRFLPFPVSRLLSAHKAIFMPFYARRQRIREKKLLKNRFIEHGRHNEKKKMCASYVYSPAC